ncbi:MAG: hypothetical protein MHMPM18_001491 [Marteilia pararefringens]
MVAHGKGKAIVGKGGKGLGKGGAKRHKKSTAVGSSICAPQLKRIARRSGCRRVSSGCYSEMRMFMSSFIQCVVSKAVAFTENANRRTITAMDIVYSLKTSGYVLAGTI